MSRGLLRELRWRAVHWALETAQRGGMVTADTPAGRKFAAFGRGSMAAFPPGSVFGERWIVDRRGHPDRRPGDAVRRDGARPGPRPGAGAADRGPLHDRPRQPYRRAPLAGHRGRRVHRPVRLHHRPEPRLRRPGHADRQADAAQRRRPHRLGQLARGRRGRAARRVHRPQRRHRGRLGGPRHGAGPVRGGGRPGPRGQVLRPRRRLVAIAGHPSAGRRPNRPRRSQLPGAVGAVSPEPPGVERVEGVTQAVDPPG